MKCKDENTIIGFLRNNDKDGYYKINLMNNKITELPRELASFGDGHPTIINNKMLLDTYPDRSRMKGLYVYNFDKNKMNIIAEFFESLEYYNETRCDLHPRFSKDNSAIYVDSVHSGKRKLFKIDLS